MQYSYQGNKPTRLPNRIRLSDGSTRTDRETYTEYEILDAGYTPVDYPLPYDSRTHVLEWDSESISWNVRLKNETELAQERKQLEEQINNHRDYRIETGFEFNGNKYDSGANDQKRISGAALLAVISGGTAGDYFWHGGDTEFVWITQDNQQVIMDAPTVIMLGKTAAEWERSHIFAARMIKDMVEIPEDWFDDSYWPSNINEMEM